MDGIVLFDRSAVGSSEERGSGAENEARNLVRENNFQKRKRVRGVVAKILLGKFHRLAGFDGSGHVHDAIEFVFLEDALEGCVIAGVAFDEFRALWHGGSVAVAEIVVDDDVVATSEELRGDDAADVSGASGDEHAIGHEAEFPQEADWLRTRKSAARRLHQEFGGYASLGDPSPSFSVRI